jgi:hypothetical protein
MKKTFATIVLQFFCLVFALPILAFEINGNVSAEGRLFANEPLYPDQERNNASFALAPEF